MYNIKKSRYPTFRILKQLTEYLTCILIKVKLEIHNPLFSAWQQSSNKKTAIK